MEKELRNKRIDELFDEIKELVPAAVLVYMVGDETSQEIGYATAGGYYQNIGMVHEFLREFIVLDNAECPST